MPILKWTGTIAGIAGALLIASNLGGNSVSFGFVLFSLSAASWVFAGWRMREPSIIAMHGTFLAINLLGIWRWIAV